MHTLVPRFRRTVWAPLALWLGTLGAASAADLAPPAAVAPATAPAGWTFSFVPYGWLTSINGTQTVRGRSVKVDAASSTLSRRATPRWP